MQAQLSHLAPHCPYLGVPEATEVWIKVKEDSLGCPGQGDSPDQQNHQHEVRERGREIHHLGGRREDRCERTKRLALAYGGKKYIFECAQETWVVAWCSWSQKRPF